jgi:hypothetical protein
MTGCDEKLCPSESVCIRVFPYEVKGNFCEWVPKNQSSPNQSAACQIDQSTQAPDTQCVCPSDQICLPDNYCVPRVSERRFCEKSCSSNSDCRSGYVCREAGVDGRTAAATTYGSIALVANPNQSMVVKFCAPPAP